MMYSIYRLLDGVVVSHVACSPKQIARNIPDGCDAREGSVDSLRFRIDPATKEIVALDVLPQQDDLGAQIRLLAQEEIDRLERAKVRALTDHVLAPDVEIVIGGRRMLPKDRVAELEVAIAGKRAKF